MKKILTNSLFFMGLTYLLCNAQDASIKNTSFPFDTSLIITCGNGSFDTCPMTISRYSNYIKLFCPPWLTVCPTESKHCDFILTKEPADSTSYLVQYIIDDYCAEDTTYHNTGIQYLVPLDSITLYMQVTSINNDTFSLRFDTASFLTATSIKPETGINPAKSAIRAEKTVRYYDLNGRVVPSKNILKNKSIVSNRMIISGNRLYIRLDH
jgi:hypothetical protein